MNERFRVLCTIEPLTARVIDDLPFTPTEDGAALQYEGPLSATLLAVYPKVEGYEVTRLTAAAPSTPAAQDAGGMSTETDAAAGVKSSRAGKGSRAE